MVGTKEGQAALSAGVLGNEGTQVELNDSQ